MKLNRYASRVVLLVAGMSFLIVARNAASCDCGPAGDAVSMAEHADAVFLGRVVALEIVPTTDSTMRPEAEDALATFVVERGWKGDAMDRIIVRTHKSNLACGYHFRIGWTYLVNAVWWNGDFQTSACMRTAPQTDAKQDIQDLGCPTYVN